MKFTLSIQGDENEFSELAEMLNYLQPQADVSVKLATQAPKPPAEPQPQPEPAPGPEPEPLPPAAKGNGHGDAPKQKRGRGRPLGSYKGPDGKMVAPAVPVAPEPKSDPEHSDAVMLDKVRLFTIAHKHLNPAIDALLKHYGADRVSRLPQDVRGTFLVQMEALLAHQANPEAPQDREWT